MRSFLVSSACAASLMLAITPAASAADVDYVSEPAAGPNWYISVFGGWSLPEDIDLSFSSTGPNSSADFSAEVDVDNGFLAGLAVGAQVNEWMRGELEVSGHWHDAGGEATLVYATLSAASTDHFDLSGDAHALFLLANVWFDIPVGEAIRPYLGGGVGVGRLAIDLEGTNTAPAGSPATIEIFDDANWGFAYQIGAGVAFDVTPHMTLDVGYRFKHINNAGFDFKDTLADGAEAEVDYTSHNLLLGLRFGF